MAKMTGFEDGETTKMINITIRDDKKKGLTSNLTVGYGFDGRYETAGIANMMSDDEMMTFLGGANNTNNSRFEGVGEASLNIPGMAISKSRLARGITVSEMAGANIVKQLTPNIKLEANYYFGSPSTDIVQQVHKESFLSGNSSLYYDRQITRDRTSNTHTAGFRLEWKINPTITFILDPDFTFSNYADEQQTTFQTINMDMDTVSNGLTQLTTAGQSWLGNTKMVVSKKFAKKGRSLSFDLRGNFSNNDMDGINKNLKVNYKKAQETSRNVIDQEYTENGDELGYYARVSYVEPLKKNRLLEFSYTQRVNKKESEKLSYDYDATTDGFTEFSPDYSNIYANTFNNYQIGLNFRSYHQKYRYILGLKAEPSTTKSESPLKEDIHQQVFNFAPTANLTYNFHKKKYLKLDYQGSTHQPTVVQLQPVADVTNPMNERKGNPDLKPRFVNNLKTTYSAYNADNFSLLTVNLSGTLTSNAIVSYSEYVEGGSGKQITYPVNVNGVYNMYGNILFNKPLFNKRITFHTNTPFRYANNVGYTKDDETKEILKNDIRELRLGERMRLMWQTARTEVTAGAEVSYNKASNEVNERQNRATTDWDIFGSLLFRLPASITINTSVNCAYKQGYAEGLDNKEIIWDIEVEKLIFKNKKGIVSLKFYDVLQQRITVTRSVGANYVEDSEYNTLKSYFLLCFAYKIDKFRQ
jgi:hypothetical protein